MRATRRVIFQELDLSATSASGVGWGRTKFGWLVRSVVGDKLHLQTVKVEREWTDHFVVMHQHDTNGRVCLLLSSRTLKAVDSHEVVLDVLKVLSREQHNVLLFKS